ncbi:MAG: PEP-CTERM sorting domain-containing protein [Planctomycetota bacterium]
MKTSAFLAALAAGTLATSASAQIAPLLNEFDPNPAGGDPAETTVELLGSPNSSYDLWILSIENDGINGTVDRASNVTGSFDANGLAVALVPDFENPSNTVILSSAFSGSIGDDLDPTDSGTLDTSSLGIVYDAVGVSDAAGDDSTLYASGLGGTDILFNGQFEPLLVFRDSITNAWYQTVTVNFGAPDQRIGAFAANGGPEIDPALFTPNASSDTFGDINPTLVPEPATFALAGLGALAMLRRRSA